METLDMIAGSAALVMALTVMVAKVMITQLLERMKRQIGDVSQIKQAALNRPKQAQSQKAVADKNKSTLERKKTKLEKKLSQLKQELAEAREEENTRRQRVQTRRVT